MTAKAEEGSLSYPQPQPAPSPPSPDRETCPAQDSGRRDTLNALSLGTAHPRRSKEHTAGKHRERQDPKPQGEVWVPLPRNRGRDCERWWCGGFGGTRGTGVGEHRQVGSHCQVPGAGLQPPPPPAVPAGSWLSKGPLGEAVVGPSRCGGVGLCTAGSGAAGSSHAQGERGGAASVNPGAGSSARATSVRVAASRLAATPK